MLRNESTPLEIKLPMPYGLVETCFLAGALGALVLVTLIGNSLVAAAVFTVRKLRHPPNFLLVSLALADFCVGVLVLPLSGTQLITGHWPLSMKFCQIWASTDVFLCTASILNLCVVSVDRYLAITDPLKYGPKRTTRRILWYILMVWILAFCISVIPVFTLVPKKTNSTDIGCQPNQNIGYQIYATMGAFYIPVAIMLIVNYKIYKAAQRMAVKERSSHERSTGELHTAAVETTNNCAKHDLCDPKRNGKGVAFADIKCQMSHDVKRQTSLLERFIIKTSEFLPKQRYNHGVRESRAVRTLSIIMGVFVICWLPFFIIALIKPIVMTINPGLNPVVPLWLDLVVLWLGYANSAINPGLYAVFNRDFRVPFREILCCRCSNMQNVMRSDAFLETYGPDPRLRLADVPDAPINSSLMPSHSDNSKI